MDADNITHLNNEVGYIISAASSMFSGKSNILVEVHTRNRIKRQNSIFVKHSSDKRYTVENFTTNNGFSIPCYSAQDSEQLINIYENALEKIIRAMVKRENLDDFFVPEFGAKKLIHQIEIDEAQFYDKGIINAIKKFQNQGTNVVMSYLKQTSAEMPFPLQKWNSEEQKYEPGNGISVFQNGDGNASDLMHVSDFIITPSAICYNCGEPATKTLKKVATGAVVQVGGKDDYAAACPNPKCFQPRQ